MARSYKALCVELADEHGFKIANPELQDQIALARQRVADAMIAVRMRMTGHREDEVERILRQLAQHTRQKEERRDWDRYARRAAGARARTVPQAMDAARRRKGSSARRTGPYWDEPVI